MHQTLVYIPLFYLNAAFCVLLAGLVLAAAWKYITTKSFGEDFWSWLGILLVGGGVVFFVAPNVAGPERMLPIRGYGFFLLLGILAAFGLLVWQSRSRIISMDTIVSLCIWAVASGIFGARLFYFIEYRYEMTVFYPDGGINFVGTLFSFFNIAGGGLVVFGSIIGGTLGSLIFMRRNRLPIFPTLDMMAPSVMIGMAFGRVGCLMNGCCFGAVCDPSYGIVFPIGSPAHMQQVMLAQTTPEIVLPVYPTQIYSSIAAALLCLLLLGFRRLTFFQNRDGLVFAAFLLLLPIIRFHLEMLRNDEPPVFGTGLTISQVVSIGLFALGILLAAWILIFAKKQTPNG